MEGLEGSEGREVQCVWVLEEGMISRAVSVLDRHWRTEEFAWGG